MKSMGRFLLERVVAGFLVIAPVYLSVLLLAKAMGSLLKLVRPIAAILPDWLPRLPFSRLYLHRRSILNRLYPAVSALVRTPVQLLAVGGACLEPPNATVM